MQEFMLVASLNYLNHKYKSFRYGVATEETCLIEINQSSNFFLHPDHQSFG